MQSARLRCPWHMVASSVATVRKSRLRASLQNMTSSPTSYIVSPMPRPGRDKLPAWRIAARHRFSIAARAGLPIAVFAYVPAKLLRVRRLRPDRVEPVAQTDWLLLGVYAPPFDVDAFLADVCEVFGDASNNDQ